MLPQWAKLQKPERFEVWNISMQSKPNGFVSPKQMGVKNKMIPVETLLTFFLASMLLALTPGPDNIFVLTQSSLYGKRSGLVVMLGLCTGLVVHSFAVALGVAVIFEQSALAFSALKLAGAGYLLYLAWQAFRASATKIQGKGNGEIRLLKLYGRGIIMNITNPKVSIFFLAFLPQFADPSKGPVWLQILILGGSLFFRPFWFLGASHCWPEPSANG